jgi:hypothetical protein
MPRCDAFLLLAFSSFDDKAGGTECGLNGAAEIVKLS